MKRPYSRIKNIVRLMLTHASSCNIRLPATETKRKKRKERKENERFSSATIAHIFQHFHPSRNLINHISPQEQKDHGQQQH